MARHAIEFTDVSFAYDSMSENLIDNLSLQFSRGWTGIIGANGSGKTTLMKLATGDLSPGTGSINTLGNAIYCQQRTDSIPLQFDQFIEATDRFAFMLKGKLQIKEDWENRWESLSHGERKRAQIGTALWLQPEILAIDEPTNHLDFEARSYLMSALQIFKGTGLLISHDKELLDLLCKQCLFIDPPDFTLRKGDFSTGFQQIQKEKSNLEKQYLQAKQEYKKLDRLIKKQRGAAAAADKKRSKKGIDKKDHDAKSKIDLARMSGKDGTAGKLMNQLNGRKKQAQSKLNTIKIKKEYETGIWQEGEQSQRKILFAIPEGTLELGNSRSLFYPKLEMKPEDKIALTGVNGAGKSTLIQFIVNSLNLPEEKVTYIPQEIDRNRSKEILQEIQNLPSKKLGVMMTAISRLGSRPGRLLESEEPSPGEIRKILLSIGVANIPHLIIMDEPTNHLDLVSIESLKEALSDYPAGLLLISHDRSFLESLTDKRWHISKDGNDAARFNLEVL